MTAENRLSTYARLVDERLDQILPAESLEPADLHRAMRYSALAPGKRLRPALCIATAEALGSDPSRVVDASCSLELVHCFSLIHDDLPAIDNDDLRRGRPTCHKMFGEGIALLAGDALFALAFDILSSSPCDPTRLLRSVRLLSQAAGSDGLVGGEVVDVLSEGKEVCELTVEYIHSRKTGALIRASCEIGAVLADGTDDEVASMAAFGEKIGLAFQIVDDVLNETSTPEQLGKAAGSDRERQKATYPALHGIEGSKEEARRMLIEAVQELGAFPHADALRDLAQYSVERLR